jgi:hypothetical protein
MTAERVYLYWDRPGRTPAPGETVTLDDGRLTVARDRARLQRGAIEERKLVVRVTPNGHGG